MVENFVALVASESRIVVKSHVCFHFACGDQFASGWAGAFLHVIVVNIFIGYSLRLNLGTSSFLTDVFVVVTVPFQKRQTAKSPLTMSNLADKRLFNVHLLIFVPLVVMIQQRISREKLLSAVRAWNELRRNASVFVADVVVHHWLRLHVFRTYAAIQQFIFMLIYHVLLLFGRVFAKHDIAKSARDDFLFISFQMGDAIVTSQILQNFVSYAAMGANMLPSAIIVGVVLMNVILHFVIKPLGANLARNINRVVMVFSVMNISRASAFEFCRAMRAV